MPRATAKSSLPIARDIVAPAHWNRDPFAILAAQLSMLEHRNSVQLPGRYVPIWTDFDEAEQEAWRGEWFNRDLGEG